MKRQFFHARHTALYAAVACVWLACAPETIRAQVESSPLATDPLLSMFVGSWNGTCTIGGGPALPAEATWNWTLAGAFLEGTLRVWRDARKQALLYERREYSRPAGAGRWSLNAFDSREVSLWGDRTGSGASYEVRLDLSDGRREAGLLRFTSATTLEYTATIGGEEGDSVESMVLSLSRRR